jgi:AbrB family looped-hinge helix DNA binding protein
MVATKTTRVSTKGWVVIPKELRDRYGLTPGRRVAFVEYGGQLTLVPVSDDPIAALAGMFATDDGRCWTEEYLAEKRRELEREEAGLAAPRGRP